jgi:XTP/dITP diphosphohydrolase
MMRPSILYVATTNQGKLRDFAAAATLTGVRIEPLPGLSEMPEAVEDGDTFAANARLKAEHYSRLAPGLWVLADDSGLEVDALDGKPGVRSARFANDENYAGEPGESTDQRNNACLLEKLRNIPDELRTARYRCVLAVAKDGRTLKTAEGEVEGRILTAPRGTGGFGYDPLFLLPQLDRTMAEIYFAAKHSLSHRGRALRALFQRWQ